MESGEVSKDTNDNFPIENNKMNVYGEKLIEPWKLLIMTLELLECIM